jgi:hypothetical protein
MRYVNKLKPKTYLILFFGLITFNLVFVNTKNYSCKCKDYGTPFTNISEMEYQNYLGSISDNDLQVEIFIGTEIKYFLNLPEKSILLIYLGYFLVASGFILTANFSLNKSLNEISG